MIEVYESTNTDFTRNGDMTLLPLTCVLYAKINGEIRVELTHQYDELGRWKYLTEENVIACPTPWGRQLFRIYKKTKNMTKITINIKMDDKFDIALLNENSKNEKEIKFSDKNINAYDIYELFDYKKDNNYLIRK